MFNVDRKIILCGFALLLGMNACSNDDANVVASNPAQSSEPSESSAKIGYIEDLKNAHVFGRAISLSGMFNGLPGEYLSYEMASKVRMYELDSATLEKTGNVWRSFILDTNGNFSFDSVSLNSPFVMIEAEPADTSKLKIEARTIFDVRKTNSVSVNLLSYLESFRLRYLFKAGVAFDSAKAQAKREVYNMMGLYDEVSDYGIVDNADVQEYLNFSGILFNQNLGDSMAISFGENGSLNNLSDRLKKVLSSEVSIDLNVVLSRIQVPYEYYEALGLGDVFLNSSSNVRFDINFLSALYGHGKCTAELKGFYFDISTDIYGLRCDGDQWNVALEKVEYSTGTMTDNRDGKTYKTVTYNFDGTVQTWMAENLDYSNVQEWCLDPQMAKTAMAELGISSWNSYRGSCPVNSSSCGVYGGLYKLNDALVLDSSFVEQKTFSECVEDYYRRKLSDAELIDTLAVTEACEYNSLNMRKVAEWADSVKSTNGFVQGICPDGWRIPSYDDWNALKEFLSRNGVYNDVLLNFAGFGLKAVAKIDYWVTYKSTDVRTEYAGVPYVMLPRAIDSNGAFLGSEFIINKSLGQSNVLHRPSFIRCIKN